MVSSASLRHSPSLSRQVQWHSHSTSICCGRRASEGTRQVDQQNVSLKAHDPQILTPSETAAALQSPQGHAKLRFFYLRRLHLSDSCHRLPQQANLEVDLRRMAIRVHLQGSAKSQSPCLVNFVSANAYFCLQHSRNLMPTFQPSPEHMTSALKSLGIIP